jgi:hypothetical protein
MDEDLDQMTHQERIMKLENCARPSVGIGTAANTSFVGTIRHFGDCCQKGQIQSPSYPNGRSSSEAALSIASRSTSRRPRRRGQMSPIKSESQL